MKPKGRWNISGCKKVKQKAAKTYWFPYWFWQGKRVCFLLIFPESVWAKGSSKSWVCILSHLHIITSSHLHNFTSSHLHIFTSSHHHIFTSSHPHIFTSSHLHILISSHLHIFTSSHPYLHIFTSSHLHIFTSSHPHILSLFLSLSLSLSPLCLSLPFHSLLLLLSLFRPRAVPTTDHETSTLSHETRFECQKLR